METVVFSSQGELLGRYASGKAAKEAHKGVQGLNFINERNFQPIGEYDTVFQLFPKPEPVQGTAQFTTETGPRNRYAHPELKGPYVVKNVATRIPPEDPRWEYADAIASCSTFEEYLEKVTPSIKFVSNSGKETPLTAKQMIRYALKRGWIAYPEGSAEAEQMAGIISAYDTLRKANVEAKKVTKAAAQPDTEQTEPVQEENVE